MKQTLHNQVEQLRPGVEPPPVPTRVAIKHLVRNRRFLNNQSIFSSFKSNSFTARATQHRCPRQDPSNARLRRARHKSRTAFASSVFNYHPPTLQCKRHPQGITIHVRFFHLRARAYRDLAGGEVGADTRLVKPIVI